MKKAVLLLLAVTMLATTFAVFSPVNAATKKIITIGDSITWGSCSGSTQGVTSTIGYRNEKFLYQGYLKSWAGSDYVIENYGVSGLPVLPDPVYLARGDKAVGNGAINNPTVKKALASNPDIVLIMLGTNDSKITKNNQIGVWSASTGGPENFQREYRKLVQTFLNLPNRPQVYLMTPPPALPDGFKLNTESSKRSGYRITNSIQDDFIVPTIRDVAQELGVQLIDVRSAFPQPQNGLNQRKLAELLMDAVHPNKYGYEVIAKTVANALGIAIPSATPSAPSTPQQPQQQQQQQQPTTPTQQPQSPPAEEATYTVTYQLSGGQFITEPAKTTYKASEELILPTSEALTKENFNLLGWSTVEASNTAEHAPGTTLAFPDHDLTLYAVWEQKDANTPPADSDDAPSTEEPSDAPTELPETDTAPIVPNPESVTYEPSSEQTPSAILIISVSVLGVLILGGAITLVILRIRKQKKD